MGDATLHAKISPSGAERWSICPGSVAMCADIPNRSSTFARDGSCAHHFADLVLRDAVQGDEWLPRDAMEYVGQTVEIDGHTMTFTKALAEGVNHYVEKVGEIWAPGRSLISERRVHIDHLTGEQGGMGTSDCTIVDPATRSVYVIDLKMGYGVRVDADRNRQLTMYASGVLRELEFVYEPFEYVHLVIIQPPQNHYSAYTMDAETFRGEEEAIKASADRVNRALAEAAASAQAPHEDIAWVSRNLLPHEDACRFCDAKFSEKGSCPAMKQIVEWMTTDVASADDFDDGFAALGDNSLTMAMDHVGLVEDWCKAVRAEAERRLFKGLPVPGWKVVEGKQGNRKWTDESKVLELLEENKVPDTETHEKSMKSAPQMEKVLKKKYPGVWEEAAKLITRPPGKPSVAPASDPRPALALSATADEFGD